ncbi:hypothetical protein J3R83DRAFT_11658 [Lanmaoa asiatica]|nr:hypothetical protein J3R83DRAFT_11658 [Lanmaoa asiatica]
MFIEQHDVEAVVPHALSHSNKLGQHSGIYLFTQATDCLKITKYVLGPQIFPTMESYPPSSMPVLWQPSTVEAQDGH